MRGASKQMPTRLLVLFLGAAALLLVVLII